MAESFLPFTIQKLKIKKYNLPGLQGEILEWRYHLKNHLRKESADYWTSASNLDRHKLQGP